jgi:hypothetical protein
MAPPMVFPPQLEGIGGLNAEEDGGHRGYCRFKDDEGGGSLLSNHHHFPHGRNQNKHSSIVHNGNGRRR